MTKDEALTLALEALENFKEIVVAAQVLGIKVGATGKNMRLGESFLHDEAITAIKEALAPMSTTCEVQPEQEPVALVIDGVLVKSALPEKYTGHLYTTPPKRTWVGLTDAEAQLIYDMGRTPAGMMEMVEAKLKEKNT